MKVCKFGSMKMRNLSLKVWKSGSKEVWKSGSKDVWKSES